jgi:CDP-glucose 4,6-dehydratase
MTKPAAEFWRGRRVLVTGHTGFKGSWLTLWLARLGAHVTGISLAPATQPNLHDAASIAELCTGHIHDIRDAAGLREIVADARPGVVFHLAAQPLVRASYRDPLGTLATNVLGTAHLLEALRHVPTVRVAVIVTTDKVYRECPAASRSAYLEADPFGGHDPYSASKAAAEIVVESYRKAFLADAGVATSTARAGNVIGGGDWAEDRLIPDAMRAWQAGTTLHVRRPAAVRPWQHVLEPLAGYLLLAEQTAADPSLAGAYNFGPDAANVATVGDVVSLAQNHFGRGEFVLQQEPDGPHESAWLALDATKAANILGVKPRWPLHEAVGRTVNWYCRHGRDASARDLCLADIAAFEATA